jgi:hypothetical protein
MSCHALRHPGHQFFRRQGLDVGGAWIVVKMKAMAMMSSSLNFVLPMTLWSTILEKKLRIFLNMLSLPG